MSKDWEHNGRGRWIFLLALAVAGILPTAGGCGRQPADDGVRDAPDRPTTENEPHALAARGQPIVTAIFRFKQEQGLWPCTLAELSPDYLDPAQTTGWRLHWRPTGWWQLVCYAGLPDWAVRYGHNGNDDGWAVTDGVHDELLEVKQPLPPPGKLSVAEVGANRTGRLQRRIEHDPKRIVHRQALCVTLYRAKDYAAARRVCAECQRLWPDHYWPHLLLARIDAERGQPEAAECTLRKWASSHEDFTPHFLLAQFLHERGDKKGAHAALDEGSKFPLADLFGDYGAGDTLGWGATQFSWAGAMIAYDEGWYDTARQICVRWEEYLQKNTRDPGHCAILAACALAQENYPEALVEAKRARKILRDRNYDWTDNLHELEQAIAGKDHTFHYKPKLRQPFVLLPEYQ